MKPYPLPDETLDTFLNGTLKVLQKKKGYRFSIDAILLSQFIHIQKNEKAIDLGTGCGILPLLLSKTTKGRSFIGVEIQKSLAECAQRNVTLNRLEDKISILHQDYRDLRKIFPSGSFDVVFSNPPYRRLRTGRINPSEEKAIARHEFNGTIDELVQVASYLLRQKGRCYLIFSSSRLIDLMVALRNSQLEPKRLQFVYPRPNEPSKFVLIESIKVSGVELTILPPLILHP
jgi:tRNA1Val (adenine37-N6)-methyltransferase